VILLFNNLIRKLDDNIIRFMSKEQQLQAQEELPKRSAKDNRRKTEKTIRISSYNYERLARLGDISWDFDRALTMVLDHWDRTTTKGGGSGKKQ
jgi:hypothetical protein